MTKKGMSGDMVLQIGLLAIAAFTTLMSVNLFYDSVEVAVYGDPYLATRTMTSYVDFIDSAPVPMKIYHEIPQDLAGNPGYGTVLYNPEECEFKVNKYSQDYMSDVILNHAWTGVTIEELLSVYALAKYNKQFEANLLRAGAHVADDSSRINNIIRSKLLREQLIEEGIDLTAVSAHHRQMTGEALDLSSHRAVRNAVAAHAAAEAMDLSSYDGSVASFWSAVDQGIANKAVKKSPGLFSLQSFKSAAKWTVTRPEAIIKGGIRVVTKPFRMILSPVTKIINPLIVKAGKGFKNKIINPIVRGLGLSKVLSATENIYIPTPFGPFPLGRIIATVLAVASYGVEYYFTYIPISHFIDRSQDATAAINKEWVSASCISKPEKVVITKPNCKSEPFAVYPDFTSWTETDSKLLNEFIDLINPLTSLESILAMPKSAPVVEIKEYEGIESEGEVCIDYHNALLAKDAGILWDTDPESGMIKEWVTNPKKLILTVPFASCGVASFIWPSWGPACTGAYALTYVSLWATPRDLAEKANLIAWVNTAGTLLATPIPPTPPNAYVPMVMNAPTVIGIDSTNFFPFVSKSSGMIDTDKYYYMENPYMISISKDYRDGEYVTEISKEL